MGDRRCLASQCSDVVTAGSEAQTSESAREEEASGKYSEIWHLPASPMRSSQSRTHKRVTGDEALASRRLEDLSEDDFESGSDQAASEDSAASQPATEGCGLS